MKPRRLISRVPTIFSTPLHYGAPVALGFMVWITGLDAQAGDILRGGGAQRGKGSARKASHIDNPTPAATDAARANARDMLARTDRTLAAMRAMQNAARNAANKGPNKLGKNPLKPAVTLPKVPNGLVAGGLKVSGSVSTDPSKWQGAKLPTQTVRNGRTKVTVKQTEQQALLEWETLNVGKNTTLTFDQKKGGEDVGKWIAFNKVADSTANPTRILGNIKADGQVYLINPNGIIFGGSSQVNARGLTASSLPINDNLIGRGLLNNPDAQFLFSGLDIAAGGNGTPAFIPEKPLDPGGKYGDVVVEKGAILSSPTNSAKVGGRITLVGPNVTNDGTIRTPDGQAILAAGLQVGFEAHSTSDPSLRGLDVYIGAVEDATAGAYAGSATQNGVVEAPRGNITIAGKQISQNGALVSTTSVSLNGRIDLSAHYDAIQNPNYGASGSGQASPFLHRKSGHISLGADSLLRILPEWDSRETAIGSELALRSQINLAGRTIHFGAESTLLAPNALVDVKAGDWLTTGSGTTLLSRFVQSSGQVYLDRGAVIDVSGSVDVVAPVSRNIVTVDLRGAELADSPLQRNGDLRNTSVMVDIRDAGIYQGKTWLGTPLADISGFANLIQRGVGELTSAGGSVTISAGNSFVTREGSRINVSGGAIEYTPGMIRTTQLLTGGRLVDISQAQPDVVYDGIYNGTFTVTNEKFGVSKTYGSPLAPAGYRFDPGSIEGSAGGSLSVTAPSMALDGRFTGKTITGEKQRATPPDKSSLNLSFTARDLAYPSLPIHSPAPPRITFTDAPRQTPAADFALDAGGAPLALTAERTADVQLSSKLMTRDGFGELTISNQDGDIIVPEEVTLKASTGSAITFNASNITIDGAIITPGGSLSFNAYNLPLATVNQLTNTVGSVLPAGAVDRGIFTLGGNATVSTAGLLIDDRGNTAASGVLPLSIAGGTIQIHSYSAKLTDGGRLDVSGGAYAGPRGDLSYGNAGSLSISAGRDLNLTPVLGGTLSLGATLAGYSGAAAGSLTLQAPAIQIGGTSPAPGVTVLAEEFFNRGGFGAFSLTGVGLASGVTGEFVTGLRVDSTARLRPLVAGVVADTSGEKLTLRRIVREEGLRTPVSLSFGASGALDSFSSSILGRGDVVIEKGAVVQTDAKGSVSISGETVTLAGSITTPGGSITISGAAAFPSNDPNFLRPTVLIGESARLSAAGKTVLTKNPYGLRQGQVLAGGSISVSGNIVAESGAVLDVSGTRGTLDLPPSSKTLDPAVLNTLRGKAYVPVTLESDGGRITLSGSRMLYSDATLIGRAGGDSATGGSVTVSSRRFTAQGAPSNTAEENLIVRQDGILVPRRFVNRGPGAELLDGSGKALPGIGTFAVSSIRDGGFDTLNLNGNVTFESDVSISLPGALRLASGGVIRGTGDIRLSAGYISIGQAFSAPSLATEKLLLFTKTDASGVTTEHTFAPTHGTGSLRIDAGLIDIGNLSLQGIGESVFDAARGDIRGNGTLVAAGSIRFKSGQLHPTTAGTFNVFAYDYLESGRTIAGQVGIHGGADRQLPLSAGGTLGIHASNIIVDGTLRAPIGTINLGWDGVGNAPVDPIAGAGIPRPVTSLLKITSNAVVSVSAVDPRTGQAALIPYGISLDGNSWIDPAGNDITVSGVPSKKVNLSADELVTEKGSVIDISGGGDLYAYRWIKGNGGTSDVLSSKTSFAVIPGYSSLYSPYAPFNTSSAAENLAGEPGYVNPNLKIGDQITLAASKGLPAGTYTLLPARYALLPGAWLITPKSGNAGNTVRNPEGSWIVSGYRSNNLAGPLRGSTVIGRYEVASSDVVRARSQYQDLLAGKVLGEAALSRGFSVPRLPGDAGYISFSSNTAMRLRGGVLSTSGDGRGSVIDINSASDILINRSGSGGEKGELVLSDGLLNSFNAESLLIGGLREFTSNGSAVTVNSGKVTLDNSGSSLTGEDVILVANGELKLARNSSITGSESEAAPDTLVFGDDDQDGSGDGVLVRVGGTRNAMIERHGVSGSPAPILTINGRANVRGTSVILDSTSATRLDPGARVESTTLQLNSGQISVLLNKPGGAPATRGLVLSGNALEGLRESAGDLSLLSYSSLDVYGSGTMGSSSLDSLRLQAASIRGFNTGAGTAVFKARNLTISAPAGGVPTPAAGKTEGTLRFDAEQITLGANAVRSTGFENTLLSADKSVLVSGKGSFTSSDRISIVSPVITGGNASIYRIESGALLQFGRPAVSSGTISPGGFGAALSLVGSQVRVNSDILLPSGALTLKATTGNVLIGNSAESTLDLAGTRIRMLDLTRHTQGGTIHINSVAGDVIIGKPASLSVAAHQSGGNAGSLNISASAGRLEVDGSLSGSAGAGNLAGSFSLDAASIPGGSLASLDSLMNMGGFTRSRDYRIRNGDVLIDGPVESHIYRVAADSGNLIVSDTIDASGKTGGDIDLIAHGSLILRNGAVLDASARDFDSSGKGGAITLEAGSLPNGQADPAATLDLRAGSVIDLTVDAENSGSASLGRFSGKLHLRAPRNADNNDIRVEAIGSTIRGASSILVEGVKHYELTGDGVITSALQNTFRNQANSFLGASGSTTDGYTAMIDRLTSLQGGLDLILAPGIELYNLDGNLTLGTATSTASGDWNLSSWRFGPRAAAGVLTLRASENLVFHNALSDGFSGGSSLWLSPLTAYNPLLPYNTQSWSMRLAAGADLSAASFRAVRTRDQLGAASGRLQLGKNAGAATVTGGANARTSSLITNLYQVIRTGSGDIDIHTGGSLQLLNPFASIYTAGTRLADATSVKSAGDFTVPILNRTVAQGNLGSAQQTYTAQYSMAGGDVTISAAGDIERKTRNNSGLIDDSSRQLPNSWLYRRGLVGADGTFGSIRIGSGFTATSDPSASTTWWVDFSNFFQGVGALGGGNITMDAGGSVNNMDAVIPTNARAAAGTPSAKHFVELGGGDLRVTTGNDISGGVYYVERGRGSLNAAGAITTNATRSPSFGLVGNLNNPDAARLDTSTWLPTTLFVGKSSFDLTSAGDLLLGPVANPFLLPQGVGNRFWYKTYFSTMAPDSGVTALSLGGQVTYRNAVTLPGQNQAQPMLKAWHETQLLFTGSSSSTAWLQPWLRLAETNLTPFSPVWSLSAPNVSLTSLSSDLNLAGDLTTFPSPTGQIEFLAAASINALLPTGISNILSPGNATRSWFSSTVNLSDANPASVPGTLAPLTSTTDSPNGAILSSNTAAGFMDGLAAMFGESGSATGGNAILQTRQARHTPGGLHADDPDPLRIHALGGNLSGLTLFSGKQARISAAADITDIALYIQNNSPTDASVVTAGRDIVAYNASSSLRAASLGEGNALSFGQSPLSGDIQISGPGTLQVMAGRDLDLGIGPNNPDGTGTGITSIGSLRNPYLTPEGADLVVGAGIGPAASLAGSQLAIDAFITGYVDTPAGRKRLREIAPGVDFEQQSPEEQARLALEVFYLVLRDTGLDYNNPKSPGYREYDAGFKAIRSLFPKTTGWAGSILTQSRDIRTRNGGNISIFAPGGGLTMAEASTGGTLAPPGIITESGGGISVFAKQSVRIGIGRIFTLRGGDITIWSSKGDIAAGSSSRTVQSAPPTRVVVDPQSAEVATDLAGLATGGGIGVLATVQGVEPGDVNLIAPSGVIDAGDAGIRVSGNINLAAVTVVNASNISAGGTSTGTPAAAVSAPSVSAVTSASNASAATNSAAAKPGETRQPDENRTTSADETLSIYTVEVISYGGGSSDEEEEEENKNESGDPPPAP